MAEIANQKWIMGVRRHDFTLSIFKMVLPEV